MGVEKLPLAIDMAIDDLNDYHSGTTVQLRKCLTRSLDVTSEAIMADLDSKLITITTTVNNLIVY